MGELTSAPISVEGEAVEELPSRAGGGDIRVESGCPPMVPGPCVNLAEETPSAQSGDLGPGEWGSEPGGGWQKPKRPLPPIIEKGLSDQEEVPLFNFFEPLVEEGLAELGETPWWCSKSQVEGFGRLMAEMTTWHKGRWGKLAVTPPENADFRTTSSAAVLKRFFMSTWARHKEHLCRAGEPAWWEQSALWGRIAMQRLRFLGERRWYAVVRTGDLQRRILVLHIPPRKASSEAQLEHARRQMTYHDTMEDLYEPGLRVKESLRPLVSERFRKGLTL